MRGRHATAVVGGLVMAGALLGRQAQAAPPWVERNLTLPAGNFGFDVGLGLHHQPDDTGAGTNLEMAVGVTSRVELGVRTGLRFGDALDRGMHGDELGRLFDRQYVGGGDDVLANPELRIRGALVRDPIVELALEGRLFVPIEEGTVAGIEPGVPLAFHLGDRVRLDTGMFVPILFTNPNADVAVHVPVDVWIQASPRVWVGPMTGVAFDHSRSFVSMGVGFGYQITHAVDFKAMFLFPRLNDETRDFGLGAGVQIRIE